MLMHPDTIRPDHSAAPFIPSGQFPVESNAVAEAMARVILVQAKDGQATELRHFRDAPETCHLSGDEIARHIGRARRIADRTIIRQDDLETAQRELAVELQQAPLRSDAELVSIAVDRAGGLLPNEAQIIAALRHAGFEIATIDRLWVQIIDRLGDEFATSRAQRVA